MMKIETEIIERIKIVVNRDDRDKAIDYCQENGYRITFSGFIAPAPGVEVTEYGFTAEKRIGVEPMSQM